MNTRGGPVCFQHGFQLSHGVCVNRGGGEDAAPFAFSHEAVRDVMAADFNGNSHLAFRMTLFVPALGAGGAALVVGGILKALPWRIHFQ